MRTIKIKCNFCKQFCIKKVSLVRYAKSLGKKSYCSYGCANRSRKKTIVKTCKWCNEKFTPKFNIKNVRFCGNKCGALFSCDQRYLKYIERWKAGLEHGGTSKNNTVISRHIRKYLFIKYKDKCCECRWSKINKWTGNIPLEVDHIDGNWKNNKENNLKLLCGNCHSLTKNYRSLNKGYGRSCKSNKKS